MKNIFIFTLILNISSLINAQTLNKADDGFRGIWYFIGQTNNEYAYKYSGGLGTYPSNHYPFAIYAPQVHKTFFCYGGISKDPKPSLWHEVAYYDHRTKQVSRPTVVLDKKTDDAHDNPVISLDDKGYIWLFSTSHGTERPSYIHRSRKPYDITTFDKIEATCQQNGNRVPFDNFSYLQIYHLPEKGFLGLMTHYERGMLKYGKNKPRRTIGYIRSTDGIEWSAIQNLGEIEEGHYQTSNMAMWKKGSAIHYKVGTAFNMHPHTEKGAGLDYRTNLYYLETQDFGKTWQTADRKAATLPLSQPSNTALIKDYRTENLNVYINDVAFTAEGQPVILYITSKGPEPGSQNGPYEWHTAHWSGKQWQINTVTISDHNYDMGSLVIENTRWRIIAPTHTGPQAYNTGGEIVLWESINEGKTWYKIRQMTQSSTVNHAYPRKVLNAHADFAMLWADGHGRQPSASSLYISNQAGDAFKLPQVMKGTYATPEKITAEACATTVFPPVLTDETRQRMEAQLTTAKTEFDRDKTNADARIWYGRRLAYLGQYAAAIQVYTDGIVQHPLDARFYRHRGHRYLTLRCLDKATADFDKAYALTRGKTDEIEPDGMPNPKGIPTSTLQSNIRYHLGLCYYLQGKFEKAIKYYEEDLKAAQNPDMYVATAQWLYLCYRRSGQPQKAQALLNTIKTEMGLIENMDYQRILLLHKGTISANALSQEVSSSSTLSNATLMLGLANYYLVNQKKKEAQTLFEKIIGGNQWASFAYITAEIETKR